MSKDTTIRGIEEIEEDLEPQRAKPDDRQQITITPGRLVTKNTPLWLRSLKAVAMIKESDRYKAASGDRVYALCMNVIPLGKNDGFPRRMAYILETDGLERFAFGKPCPNNSLESSIYCRSCKKIVAGKESDDS